MIQFDPFYQTYNFIEGSSNSYIVSYVRKSDSISCYLECPYEMEQIINEYLKMFDKESKKLFQRKIVWKILGIIIGLKSIFLVSS